MTDSRTDPGTVFISYSHQDAMYLARLQEHLAPYIRSGAIPLWDDTRLKPGDDWKRGIEEALHAARVAVLLVSVSFLASEFVMAEELPKLLAGAEARGTRILPVILTPCNFRRTTLNRFQAVNDPTKPLSGLTPHEQDLVWERVVEVVLEVLATSAALTTKVSRQGALADSEPEEAFPVSGPQPDLLPSPEKPDAVAVPAPDTQAPPPLQPMAIPEAPPVPDPPLTQAPQSNAFAQKEPWVGEGDQHLAARRYQEALAWYEQALAVDTASVRALQGKSLALYYLNHPIEALAVAQTVLHLDPTNAEGYWNQGLILHASGRHEEAAAAYDKARQRNPALGLDWRLPMGTLLRTLKGHTSAVRSVSWSSDGRRLASASADTTIRFWDAATGQLLTTLTVSTPV